MRKAHILLRNPKLGTTVFTDKLAEVFQLESLHIREIIREAYSEDSPLSVRLKSFMESGKLIPDELITELVERNSDFSGDFLLVDYPRTVNQFHELLALFQRKGILLQKLWILQLNDIEPFIESQENAALKLELHQKFAEESEGILRDTFQNATKTIELIKQAFDKQIHIESITYDHPLESSMEDILAKLLIR